MYIVNKFELVFSFNVKAYTIYSMFTNIRLSYNITVRCQSECTCLHKTVNMVVVFVESNENTYPKGRALTHMYRVVPITKRGNCVKRTSVYEVI